MLKLFFAALLLVASSADAMVSELRVEMTDCSSGVSCQRYWNVGACVTVGRVGDQWIVVSSGHHLSGGKPTGKAFVATFSGPKRVKLAGFVYSDETDLSVWLMDDPGNWRAVCVSSSDPAKGESVRQFAQGPRGKYITKPCRVKSCDARNLITSVAAIQGDSGAPLMRQSESVVLGIVRATDGAATYCVPASKVREVVSRFVPSFACCAPVKIAPPAPPDDPGEPAKPTHQPPGKAPELVLDYDKLADALLERMAADDRFKGAPGPPGESGKEGPPGPVGPRGEAANVAQIEAEIAKLKARKRKVVLVKDNQIVDEEEYGIDEPIVLDFQRFIKPK